MVNIHCQPTPVSENDEAALLVAVSLKLDEYVSAGHLAAEDKPGYAEVFEQMQGVLRERNVYADPGRASAAATDAENAPMTPRELQAELESREVLLQRLRERGGVMTDQWRVYQEIITAIQNGKYLRMIVQASAGLA